MATRGMPQTLPAAACPPNRTPHPPHSYLCPLAAPPAAAPGRSRRSRPSAPWRRGPTQRLRKRRRRQGFRHAAACCLCRRACVRVVAPKAAGSSTGKGDRTATRLGGQRATAKALTRHVDEAKALGAARVAVRDHAAAAAQQRGERQPCAGRPEQKGRACAEGCSQHTLVHPAPPTSPHLTSLTQHTLAHPTKNTQHILAHPTYNTQHILVHPTKNTQHPSLVIQHTPPT